METEYLFSKSNHLIPFSDLIARIQKGMSAKSADMPYVVAIDGMSTSGKTTLAGLLQKHFPQSVVFHMDDYFLQAHQRTPKRVAEVGGNVDYERFYKEIILHLTDKDGFHMRKFSCSHMTLEPPCHLSWQPLILIEGAYSQHPFFGSVYDLRLFGTVSPSQQLARIQKRNGSQQLEAFLSRWIPMEQAYFTTFHISEQSILFSCPQP